MTWTDGHIELMTQLWKAGLSASQIAPELGDGFTRNAVIGKLHRLGLSCDRLDPKSPIARAPKQHRKSPGANWQKRVAEKKARTKAEAPVEPLASAEIVDLRPRRNAPVSKRLTIEDLDFAFALCRWPTDGEGEHTLFCGHAVEEGSSYCEFHAGIAYVKAEPRKGGRPRSEHAAHRGVAA